MKRFLAFVMAMILAIPVPIPALAQVYYRNCDTGSQVGCTPGSNASAGTSMYSPKQSLPTDSQISSLPAGSIVRLCNGSAWVDSNFPGWFIENTNATEASPITIEGWNCDDGLTARPILQAPSAAGVGIVFGGFCMSGCPSPDHGGYVLRGLQITKSGALASGSTGLNFYGSARYVLLENIELNNWANAAEVQTAQNIRNLTLRSSYIHDNAQNGWVGSATDMLLETTHFQRNNRLTPFTLEHGVYIGGLEPKSRITIRGNYFEDNSVDTADNVCKSGNITLRGNVTEALIEDNTIKVPSGNIDCYGISVINGYGGGTECVSGLVARRNKVVNVGSNSIAVLLGPGADIDSNEVIHTTSTGGHNAISIGNPSDPADTAVCPAGNATVRNNSGYLASGSGGAFVTIAAGAGHKVYNNLCFITAGTTSTNCWSTSGATFSVFDYNWSYELGSGQYSGTYATRAAACTGSSFDCNGGTADPQLASTPGPSNTVIQLSSTSPLRGAGRPTGAPVRDSLKCFRKTTPDIGAHEYGASVCPTTSGTPQFVR